MRAESSLVDAKKSWPSLFRHHRSFTACDDGALGEGYSDAVATLLANKWDQLSVFVALSKKYPDFYRWVIRHIDATASEDDLKLIIINADSCINKGIAKAPCETIRRSAVMALQELERIRK